MRKLEVVEGKTSRSRLTVGPTSVCLKIGRWEDPLTAEKLRVFAYRVAEAHISGLDCRFRGRFDNPEEAALSNQCRKSHLILTLRGEFLFSTRVDTDSMEESTRLRMAQPGKNHR